MATTTKKSSARPNRSIPAEPIHYTEKYLIDPMHPVTINVIGCGGTGSQVLNTLARMNSALKALGHPGLFVRAIDPDRVSSANMGRQLFSPSDLNQYKCMALIGKINRFFGTDWEGVPLKYATGTTVASANVTISCVDTGAARKEIKSILQDAAKRSAGRPMTNHPEPRNIQYISDFPPYDIPYYWMDFGNMADRGQMVMGTVRKIIQPKESSFRCLQTLPTIDELHPDIFRDLKSDDQGPSCSLAEALSRQDLLINSNLANMGLGILWKMFREARIRFHGLYMNLDSMAVNPIKIR